MFARVVMGPLGYLEILRSVVGPGGPRGHGRPRGPEELLGGSLGSLRVAVEGNLNERRNDGVSFLGCFVGVRVAMVGLAFKAGSCCGVFAGFASTLQAVRAS